MESCANRKKNVLPTARDRAREGKEGDAKNETGGRGSSGNTSLWAQSFTLTTIPIGVGERNYGFGWCKEKKFEDTAETEENLGVNWGSGRRT